MTPIADFLRNVKYGLQNLWKWKRIIYVDRDWDWAFLYQIIEFKLEQMIILQNKYGVCEDKDIIVTEMRRAQTLLKRLVEDEYGNNLNAEAYYTEMYKDRNELFTLMEEKSMGWWD